ncbi:nitrate- and nitrite sensing domain-containing protein [Streptomyces beijiangensis]
MAGVAVVGITVLAAGAPSVVTASTEVSDAQHLVDLAALNQQAVSLAHTLADERDDVTVYIAAGRSGKQPETGGVDRAIDEISAEEAGAPDGLRRDLAGVPGIRRTALTGKGGALDAQRAYSEVVGKLQDLAEQLAEQTPPEAAPTTRAPLALGRAADQASATRGLLLAALAVPRPAKQSEYDPMTGTYVLKQPSDPNSGTRDALSAAAQQSRVRELGALADFDQAAQPAARESLVSTVSGTDVNSAERYLTRLADQPKLSDADLKTSRSKLDDALSARIDQMRSVESTLGVQQEQRLAKLRDDRVTALEIQIAETAALLLLAIGVSTAVARTLTRPLAVLRIGAARLAGDPEAEDPIRFTGRNDEFAQVVRSLNTLHGKFLAAGSRAQSLVGGHSELADERGALADDRAELQARTAELEDHAARVGAQLEQLRSTVHTTFVNLALRSLGVVDRQLTVIESLEEREQDPEGLATLFKLDHMATVLRRHSENLLVLAGADHGHGHGSAVPLVDVLRAAVSEIERYERIAIQSLPPHAQVAGFAADDISHLVAELLENATSFSPPDAQVALSAWMLESGEVMVSVQDEGIGMAATRRTEINARLAEPDPEVADTSTGLGLHVAALLAARHGVRIELREQQQGGTAAVVVLPAALLPTEPPVLAVPHRAPVPGAAPALHLPGQIAEANSNALPTRSRYDIGPDAHERAPEPLIDEPTFTMRRPDPEPEPEPERAPVPKPAAGPGSDPVTVMGLPKRTPKITRPDVAPEPKKRPAGVDADALRRRLGGFHQGAKDGRRDVEAEIEEIEETAGTTDSDDAGDSVEEARS